MAFFIISARLTKQSGGKIKMDGENHSGGAGWIALTTAKTYLQIITKLSHQKTGMHLRMRLTQGDNKPIQYLILFANMFAGIERGGLNPGPSQYLNRWTNVNVHTSTLL